MKCKSCQSEVSPKFAHAIGTNTCPFCGDEIMDSELQGALKGLGDAMKAVDKYPVEVFDWLSSNFGLVKESDLREKLRHEFSVKPRSVAPSVSHKSQAQSEDYAAVAEASGEIELDSDGNQITGQVIQDPSVTNKFLRNAGIKQRSDALKDLVKQIKKTSGSSNSKKAALPVDPEDLSGPELARMNPEELEQLESMISGDFSGPISALSGSEDSYDDEIPSFVLNMANGAKKGADYNHQDVMKLQKLQGKSSSVRSEISRSGGVGLIRR